MKNNHEKLDTKTRIYLKNFSLYLVVVATVIFIFGVGEQGFDRYQGLFLVSLFCIFGFGHLISMKFVNSEKIEEYKKKNGISNEEFNKRYKYLI